MRERGYVIEPSEGVWRGCERVCVGGYVVGVRGFEMTYPLVQYPLGSHE